VTSQQFAYIESDSSLGAASALPYMPISLIYGEKEVSVSALVDSGAALSVLPYSTGVQLGAVWDEQTIPVNLSGNLAASEAAHYSLPAAFPAFHRSVSPSAGHVATMSR